MGFLRNSRGFRCRGTRWSCARGLRGEPARYCSTAERSKEIAVGRTGASATSPRATRGTSTQSAPTAERSHFCCISSLNGKQRRARHRLRRTLLLGLTMRPLRGRTEVGGGTAGRVCSLHSPPRPTAISFDRGAVDFDRPAVDERLRRCSGILQVGRDIDRCDISQVSSLQRSTASNSGGAISVSGLAHPRMLLRRILRRRLNLRHR